MSSPPSFKFDYALKPAQKLTFNDDGVPPASDPAANLSESQYPSAPQSPEPRAFVVSKKDFDIMKALQNSEDSYEDVGLAQEMQGCFIQPKRLIQPNGTQKSTSIPATDAADATPNLALRLISSKSSRVSAKAASRVSNFRQLIKPTASAPTTPTGFRGTSVDGTFKQQIESYKSQVMVANRKAREARAQVEQSRAKMDEIVEINEDLTRQNLLKEGEIAAAHQKAEEDAETIKMLRRELECKEEIIEGLRNKCESRNIALDK
jgi:hypothetical protein